MIKHTEEFDSKVRELVREQLAKCTPEQIKFFDRMYGSIEEIPGEKMRWAYVQIKNTLEGKNV